MNEKNLNQEEVSMLILTFNEEPLFNKVIITLNTEEVDGNLVLSENTMSEVQYVIAKGSSVHNLELGQKVRIDLEKLMVAVGVTNNTHETTSQLKISPIQIGEFTCAIIEDRFIKTKFIN